MKKNAFAMGVFWFISTVVAGFAWMTHYGWPHSKGSASGGACAVTAFIWVMLGVLFAIAAVTDRG